MTERKRTSGLCAGKRLVKAGRGRGARQRWGARQSRAAFLSCRCGDQSLGSPASLRKRCSMTLVIRKMQTETTLAASTSGAPVARALWPGLVNPAARPGLAGRALALRAPSARVPTATTNEQGETLYFLGARPGPREEGSFLAGLSPHSLDSAPPGRIGPAESNPGRAHGAAAVGGSEARPPSGGSEVRLFRGPGCLGHPAGALASSRVFSQRTPGNARP